MTKGNSYPTDNTCLAKHRVKGIKSPDTFIFFHMSQAGWASMTEMLHFLRAGKTIYDLQFSLYFANVNKADIDLKFFGQIPGPLRTYFFLSGKQKLKNFVQRIFFNVQIEVAESRLTVKAKQLLMNQMKINHSCQPRRWSCYYSKK